MDALNALRAVLVGCAFVATMILATRGQWIPATVLTVGILAHLLLFGHQRVEQRRRAERLTALEG